MGLHHEPLCFLSVLSGLYLPYRPVVRYLPLDRYLPYRPSVRDCLSVLSLRDFPVDLGALSLL